VSSEEKKTQLKALYQEMQAKYGEAVFPDKPEDGYLKKFNNIVMDVNQIDRDIMNDAILKFKPSITNKKQKLDVSDEAKQEYSFLHVNVACCSLEHSRMWKNGDVETLWERKGYYFVIFTKYKVFSGGDMITWLERHDYHPNSEGMKEYEDNACRKWNPGDVRKVCFMFEECGNVVGMSICAPGDTYSRASARYYADRDRVNHGADKYYKNYKSIDKESEI
jgi:hypothetical protein